MRKGNKMKGNAKWKKCKIKGTWKEMNAKWEQHERKMKGNECEMKGNQCNIKETLGEMNATWKEMKGNNYIWWLSTKDTFTLTESCKNYISSLVQRAHHLRKR